jgi:phosphoribosylanthranilate isomerase
MNAPKVKICGLTNLVDAQVAVEAGADLLGFIFYEPSPRYVEPSVVQSITAAVRSMVSPERRPQFVGVIVNHSADFVEKVVSDCGLDFVQFHGEETPETLRPFGRRAYKACNPRSLDEAEAIASAYLGSDAESLLMLDAYHPKLRGGTGHTADWASAAQIARKHKLLLAGGLHPDNVIEAIRVVQPWGVDVSSGVEASKGKKDHDKVRLFIERVKSLPSERIS